MLSVLTPPPVVTHALRRKHADRTAEYFIFELLQCQYFLGTDAEPRTGASKLAPVVAVHSLAPILVHVQIGSMRGSGGRSRRTCRGARLGSTPRPVRPYGLGLGCICARIDQPNVGADRFQWRSECNGGFRPIFWCGIWCGIRGLRGPAGALVFCRQGRDVPCTPRCSPLSWFESLRFRHANFGSTPLTGDGHSIRSRCGFQERAPGRSGSAHQRLEVARNRHSSERADVGPPSIARGNQAECGFCGSSEDTKELPSDLPAARLAPPPAHHQDVCLYV
jgi:hypothetical protein